jgi:hypothetical protein
VTRYALYVAAVAIVLVAVTWYLMLLYQMAFPDTCGCAI